MAGVGIIAARRPQRMSPRALKTMGWWLLALLLALGFALLGRWQFDRMHQKQALLARAQSALHAAPQPLLLASDRKRAQDYDLAHGGGRLLNRTFWLDGQQFAGRVGVRMYCVLLPDIGSQALLVDAGWWPFAGDRQLPKFGCPARGDQQVRGLLAPPPSEGIAHGDALATAGAGRWLMARMDLGAVAATLQLPGGIAPRVLRLDPKHQRGDSGVMLAPGQRDLVILPNTMSPERHLGYALQWFGLAALVLVVALVMSVRKKTV